MERDGISTLPRHLRGGICVHVMNPGHPIVVRCHKRQRYQTPKGRVCFAHAMEQATDV
jgi:hypothetical protein